MRLIDADAFKEMLGTDTKIRKMVCEVIDTQPTAYNLDAVVEELEEAKCEIALNEDDLNIYCGALDDAIDIVRKGGVNNDN